MAYALLSDPTLISILNPRTIPMKMPKLVSAIGQFRSVGILTAVALATLAATSAQATLVSTPTGPYTTLDDAYTATIYAADTNYTYTLGVAFVGNTLVRSADNGTLYVYDNTTSTVHGNTVANYTTHTVGGDGWNGRGITGDGQYVYGNGGGGLFKIDLSTYTSTRLANSVGGQYGISFLNSHQLVYNAGSEVRLYDLTTQTDTLFFNGVSFGDGLSVTPDGHVIIADLSGYLIRVLDSSGNQINTFSSTHDADGTAYGAGSIFKANTDGTLSKVDFSGPNFTGVGTETLLATGLQYSDLSTVGPDGSFYISALGAHYADGYSYGYADGSLIKVSLLGGGGFGPGSDNHGVPDSGITAVLLGSALLGLAAFRRRFLS